MITPDTFLERNPDLVTAALGNELAMMDVDTGIYFVLDETAAFIWERLSEKTTLASLLDALQRQYDVSPERCQSDVLPFLLKLHAKQLVRIQE
ncbi:MAG TPA: PqqD family protein [Thermoanaerobaculia bacterium]|nr:PqqD family protein [Thermoanaerobaculia bacterium]